MNFQPFLEAGLTIQLHATTAILAFFLGLYLLIVRKGDARHKFLGKLWLMLMVTSALSSLAISEIKTWGYFSPIHLLVPFTLWGSFEIIHHARKRKMIEHRKSVVSLFSCALIVAGLFTFLPGRTMSETFFAQMPWVGFGIMTALGILITVWIISVNFPKGRRSAKS